MEPETRGLPFTAASLRPGRRASPQRCLWKACVCVFVCLCVSVCAYWEGDVEVNVFIPLPAHVCPQCCPFWARGTEGSWEVGVAGGMGDTGLTHRHESYDQLGVGDVGASHSGPADALADVRVHAAHLVCRRSNGRRAESSCLCFLSWPNVCFLTLHGSVHWWLWPGPVPRGSKGR